MIVAIVAASSLHAAPLTETRTPDLHAHFSKAKVHVVNAPTRGWSKHSTLSSAERRSPDRLVREVASPGGRPESGLEAGRLSAPGGTPTLQKAVSALFFRTSGN